MKSTSLRYNTTASGTADAPAQAPHRAGVKSTMWSAKTSRHIATINVRSLYKPGKLKIVQENLKRIEWDIVGISETHWPGEGSIDLPEGRLIYSGRGDGIHREGVAILIRKQLIECLVDNRTISSRTISIRIKGKEKGTYIKIIQVYAPDSSHLDSEVESFYRQLQDEINRTHSKDILYIMGDFNAKIGGHREDLEDVVGNFGIGEVNERGEELLNFCKDNNLVVANTLFYHRAAHKYTWTSPDGTIKNCIDYIIVRKRWKSSINNVKTLRSLDFDTDHEYLTAKTKIGFRTSRPKGRPRKINLEKAKDINVKKLFQTKIEAMKTQPISILEEHWKRSKSILIESAEDTLGFKETPRRPWITQDILDKIEEKRKQKIRLNSSNSDENKIKFKQLKIEVDRLCRLAKEKWLNDKAEQCEEANRFHDSKKLFSTIKEITRPFSSTQISLYNHRGEETGNPEELKAIWTKHFSEVFRSHNSSQPGDSSMGTHSVTSILKEEVKQALSTMKQGRAPGVDRIPTEIWSMGEDITITYLTDLFNHVLETGEMPDDWKTGVVIPIHKKGDRKECKNFRPITLLSHAYKIFARILQNRLKNEYEQIIGREQAGFRKDHSTVDAIFTVTRIGEFYMDQHKSLYLCFIDFKQAFDSVDRNKLLEVLKHKNIRADIIDFLTAYYKTTNILVKHNNIITDKIKIEKGVAQGCPISPYLFNIFLEEITTGALEGEEGVKVNGSEINHLKYADDVVLIADTKNKLENLIEKLNLATKHYSMTINLQKTKTMVISRKQEVLDITVNNEHIEQVNKFNYLGAIITSTLNNFEPIKQRLSIAWSAMTRLNKIWKSTKISEELKLKLYKTLVIPIAIYSSESWIVQKKESNRVDAFESKCLRKINRTVWTEMKTNNRVRQELNYEEKLTDLITKRQLQWFGHVERMNQNRLPRVVVYAFDPEKRKRGRPRTKWISALKKNSGLSTFREMTTLARDRETWKAFIHGGLHP